VLKVTVCMAWTAISVRCLFSSKTLRFCTYLKVEVKVNVDLYSTLSWSHL